MNQQKQNSTKWLEQKISSNITFRNMNFQKTHTFAYQKNKDTNPAYQLLKRKRNNKMIIESIMKIFNKKTTLNKDKFRRTRSCLSEPRTMPITQNPHYVQNQQKKHLKQKSISIIQKSKKVQEFIQKSSKRVKLLGTFNKAMEKYYNHLPQKFEQGQRNQFVVANEILFRENYTSIRDKNSLYQRVRSIKIFQEPKIDFKDRRKLKIRYKTEYSEDKKQRNRKLKIFSKTTYTQNRQES